MSQEALLLVVTAITGIYATRWMTRLAPTASELPMKTLLATIAAAAVVVAELAAMRLDRTSLLIITALAPLYVFAPLAIVGIARARQYRLALGVATALYWTAPAQDGIRRLLAQVALQHGDADTALELLPRGADSNLLRAQAYALQERWQEILALELPDGGDNALLGMEARAHAHLEIGNLPLAEFELAQMERRHAQSEGPVGHRAVMLARARIAAERGNFEGARSILQDPLEGLPPYVVFSVLARAAERGTRHDAARQLYAQAYVLAPEPQRPRLARELERRGDDLPEVTPVARRSTATLVLLATILGTYAVQAYLASSFGTVAFGRHLMEAGHAAAAFLHNIPLVPEGTAPWRYLSYAFVHGNLVHIAFNAWVLFDVGRLYETRRSSGSLVTAFTIGTFMGAYFTTLGQAAEQVLLVGASGGVLGVVGALLADVYRGATPGDRQLQRALVQWIVIIMLFSLLPGISLWGHLGGLVGGLLWGFARQGLPNSAAVDRIAGAGCTILLVVTLAAVAQWITRYL